MFDQIFLYKELEFQIDDALNYVIDAGANIGLASIYLAKRFPHAQIIALEVDKENYNVLMKNIEPYNRIKSVYKGLWHREANLIIENPNDYSWAFTVSETEDDTKDYLKGISIATLIKEYNWPHIDLLKMDIEGGELMVLSLGTDAWVQKVKTIAVEVHYSHEGCWEAFCKFKEKYHFELSWAGEYAILQKDDKSN